MFELHRYMVWGVNRTQREFFFENGKVHENLIFCRINFPELKFNVSCYYFTTPKHNTHNIYVWYICILCNTRSRPIFEWTCTISHKLNINEFKFFSVFRFFFFLFFWNIILCCSFLLPLIIHTFSVCVCDYFPLL